MPNSYQTVSIFSPGVIPIRGRADADAKVAVTTTVGGTSATYMPERSGQDFSIDIPVDNSQGPVTAQVTVDALRHDGTLDIDLHRRLSGDYTVPAATPEAPTYDLDGNLLSHDGWACAWNAQDRLVSARKGDMRLEFNYDYLGRRFEKKVYESNALVRHQLFVYDGFKQIADYDALDSNALANTYVWQLVGLDVPLLRNGSEFFVSDANKNIVALLDTNGSVTDTYLYDPFGNCTHSGSSTNPFRFSSEYFDEEADLIYYNYRYYSPDFGRWLQREQIGEQNGLNLYSICHNQVINRLDCLGLHDMNDYMSGEPDFMVPADPERYGRITDIPDIMRKNNMPVGASLMEHWFASTGDAYYVAMDWALGFQRARMVYDQIINEKLYVNAAAQKRIKEMVHNFYPEGGDFGTFAGDLQSLDEQHIQSRRVGNPLRDPLDDLFATLGRFTFRVLVKGEYKRKPGIYCVSQFAIYIFDSYDFNGPQYLGNWNKAKGKVSKIGLAMWVSNNSFRRYQMSTGKGKDFNVFSDLKIHNVPGGWFSFR